MADIGAHDGGKRVKNGHETLIASPGTTLAESLRQKLEGAIAAGHLMPGSRLDEQEIAQRFGVSRTPVREAFRLMAANNLVELRGRQGATVRSIKAQALIEMFQVMAELEGLCARLAARRVSQAWGVEIGKVHQRLVAAGESGDIAKAIQFGTANSTSVVQEYGAVAGILKKGDWGKYPLVEISVSPI